MSRCHPERLLCIFFSTATLIACTTPNPSAIVDKSRPDDYRRAIVVRPGHAAGSQSPDSMAASTAKPAKEPVKPRKEANNLPTAYIVRKGDTLYGIALDQGQDYKDLAAWNNIGPPYVIQVGQSLRLSSEQLAGTPGSMTSSRASPGSAVTDGIRTPLRPVAPAAGDEAKVQAGENKPAGVRAAVEPLSPHPLPPEGGKEGADTRDLSWAWPAQGRVIAAFAAKGGSKGIDIAGTRGQPVRAAASGKVVYGGTGIRGYGQLVIIKHGSTLLSAYAHNARLLVKEGQWVEKGQPIAEMGDSDSNRVKLHFEIRRMGKPVDPMLFLPSDKAL